MLLDSANVPPAVVVAVEATIGSTAVAFEGGGAAGSGAVTLKVGKEVCAVVALGVVGTARAAEAAAFEVWGAARAV